MLFAWGAVFHFQKAYGLSARICESGGGTINLDMADDMCDDDRAIWPVEFVVSKHDIDEMLDKHMAIAIRRHEEEAIRTDQGAEEW